MTEETQKNPGVVATHGMVTEWVGEDGVSKRMELTRLSDGDIGVAVLSYWDGADKPPMKTVLRFKSETVSILGECIFRFFNELDRWKIPEE